MALEDTRKQSCNKQDMKEHVQTRLDVLRGEHFLMQQRERLEFRHSTRHWRSGKDRVKSSTHLLTLFHLVLKHGTEHRRASWDRERNKSSEHASIYRKRGVKGKQNAKELLVSLCSEVPKSLKVKKKILQCKWYFYDLIFTQSLYYWFSSIQTF